MRDLGEISRKYRGFQALSFVVGVRDCPVLWEWHLSLNLPDSSLLSAGGRRWGREKQLDQAGFIFWTASDLGLSDRSLMIQLQWKKANYFPPFMCPALERLLSGGLHTGSPAELFPWSLLPTQILQRNWCIRLRMGQGQPMFRLHKYVSAGEGMGQRRRERCKVGDTGQEAQKCLCHALTISCVAA